MRLSDIFWLSLSTLAQQRLRTLLSTLGVFFASFVLVMSLSMGRGVQEAIAHEYSRFTGLRQIDVLKTYESAGDEEKIEVKGVMSEPRRLRLRHEIYRRQAQDPGRIAGTRLTPRMLPLLSEIPHVASVTADVGFYPRAILDNHIEQAFVHSSPPDHNQLLGRIVAGRFLNAHDADSALVTEYLLFRLGIVDETAIQAALGRKLRLEYQADGTTIGREVAIVGVLRSASRDDLRNHYRDGWTENVDVVLPVRTATELFFEAPGHREWGLGSVIVEVDSLENVKVVARAIDALGLHSNSLVEVIEQHQFTYLLLFAAMACIAAVALLVAALGIINTMLMSVMERIREIGVMKAVGARDGHIQCMFLLQGTLIGLTGGLLGLLACWAVSLPADAWVRSLVASRSKMDLQESVFVWPSWLLIGTPMFACCVTTLAALYPARRAARVTPITALRHE